MTKHWMTKKAIVVAYEIKGHQLDTLGKNGAIRMRLQPRKKGQRGRTPTLYNVADARVFMKMTKETQIMTLQVWNEKPLAEWWKEQNTVPKGSKDLEDAINDFDKSNLDHIWFPKKENAKSAWDSLKKMPEEMVNHPKHYNPGKIEVIDAIEDWRLDFNEGNVIKYIVRAKRKNNRKQDLQKALWYIQRMLDNL